MGRRKLTTEQVVDQFKEIHGDKYDYSLVQYVGALKKLKIICPEHGVFEQIPQSHKNGRGCPKCSVKAKLTTEEVVKQFKEIHGDKYDYSLVEHVNNRTKVKIICPEHGVFEQTPDHHKQGQGCPKCFGNKKLTTEQVVNKFKEVHGDKYDYSLVKYVNNETKVKIICPEHGVFDQRPNDHKKGVGCPKCSGTGKLTTKEVVKQFKEIHGDKYDYSLVKYVSARKKVKIICPEHGVFELTPDHHKRGVDCSKCADYGFNPNKRATLYVLEIEGKLGTNLQKIGITNNSVNERFIASERKHIKKFKEYVFNDGEDALKYENIIKERFQNYACQAHLYPLISGHTETYLIKECLFDEVEKMIENKEK